MTTDDTAPNTPESAGHPERESWMKSANAAIQYMRSSAVKQVKRDEDRPSALALPLSCVLLFAAIVFPGAPFLKALGFLLPMTAFAFYILARLGIVATFNPRQAYLTWHILIATFLFGGSCTLFVLYVVLHLAKMSGPI